MKKKPTQLERLDAAIADTRRKIADHETARRHLAAKLHNQLAEFYRQATEDK